MKLRRCIWSKGHLIGMAPLITFPTQVWKILTCTSFVKLNNFDHSHIESEIITYRNAWTPFAKGHVCGELWQKKSKRGFEKCHNNKVHDDYVYNSFVWIIIGSNFLSHRFHKGVQNVSSILSSCHPCCHCYC